MEPRTRIVFEETLFVSMSFVRAISKTHIRIAGVDHDLTNHAGN